MNRLMDSALDNNEITPEYMLTVQDVAYILNVHPSTVRRWESKGLLQSFRIGPRRIIRFALAEVADFLHECRTEAHVLAYQRLEFEKNNWGDYI